MTLRTTWLDTVVQPDCDVEAVKADHEATLRRQFGVTEFEHRVEALSVGYFVSTSATLPDPEPSTK